MHGAIDQPRQGPPRHTRRKGSPGDLKKICGRLSRSACFYCPYYHTNDCCLETPSPIWYLIARALNGEASQPELEELNHQLKQDEQLQQQFDLLVRVWAEKHNVIKDDDNINAGITISRIISRAANEKTDEVGVARRKRRWRKRSIAGISSAVLAVIAFAGWKLMQKENSQPAAPEKEAIVTHKGSRSQTRLADGTTVWLNAGSTLSYENDFNGSTREVKLEGEAFFDVTKQPGRPFIVHTSGIDIKVLGTTFNVKSYPEDKNVETTLYKGVVQVFRPEDASSGPIQLKPNQKLSVPKKAAKETFELSEDKTLTAKKTPAGFTITPIDSTKKESERIETAWVYNRLEFEGESFENVAKKLERWFNISIIFTDDRVKKLEVVGKFDDETVNEAFEALKFGFHLNYKIEKNEVYVGSSD
jgi:ferric-dicitrate binding protein FerR (iron transport regulator)